MKNVTHADQQRIWDDEHRAPTILPQMDARDPSSAVEAFLIWLQDHGVRSGKGLEMGCGKGRNCIFLAGSAYTMDGFDFSRHAIEESKRRAAETNLQDRVTFHVMDATLPWEFPDGQFNFAVDCFASTDIESGEGRVAAAREMHRVLRSGGYLLVYAASSDDTYHTEIIAQSPGEELHTFVHPRTGKFEKIFSLTELQKLYQPFRLLEHRLIEKKTTFQGREYPCLNHWCIFQKA